MMYNLVFAAGHGGRDTGAIGVGGIREKDVNLVTTLAARDCLEEEFEGHNIIMTRTTDVFVTLPEQRKIAHNVNADGFIEVHYNAATPTGHGFETFTLRAPDDRVFPITRVMQRKVHNAVMDYVGPLGLADRGMKQGRYYHMVGTNAPCLLVECAFLTSTHDYEIVRTKQVQQNIGRAIAYGVAEAFKLPRKQQAPAPVPPDVPPISSDFEIIRPVYIYVEGIQTNVHAWLTKYEGKYKSVGMLVELAEALGYKIEGKGDRINLWK